MKKFIAIIITFCIFLSNTYAQGIERNVYDDYLQVINDLLVDYKILVVEPENEIGDITFKIGDENYLLYLNLIDFDNNGTEELMVAYSNKYNENDEGDFSYIYEIYGEKDGRAQKIVSRKIPCIFRRGVISNYLKKIDGITYIVDKDSYGFEENFECEYTITKINGTNKEVTTIKNSKEYGIDEDGFEYNKLIRSTYLKNINDSEIIDITESEYNEYVLKYEYTEGVDNELIFVETYINSDFRFDENYKNTILELIDNIEKKVININTKKNFLKV